jgi:uncharacterized OB-fold protein
MDNNYALPPSGRTPVWRHITKAAKSGDFVLQVCQACETVQYPPRELCKDCLQDKLEWQKLSPQGELISHTNLHASTNAFFREYLPRKIALIKMDCGPIIFAHIAYSDAKTGDRLTIISKRDLSGEGVFIALTDLIEANVQLDQLNKLLLQD